MMTEKEQAEKICEQLRRLDFLQKKITASEFAVVLETIRNISAIYAGFGFVDGEYYQDDDE